MSRPTRSTLPLLAVVGGACGLLAVWPGQLAAQDPRLDTHIEGASEGFGDHVYRDQNAPAASLSDSASGTRWDTSARVVFGAATVRAASRVPPADNIDFGYGGFADAYADWEDLFTVTTSPPAAGRLRFTMRFSGNPVALAGSSSRYDVTCGGVGGAPLATYQQNESGTGNPAPPVFTFDVAPFGGGPLVGAQFYLQFAIQAYAQSGSGYHGGVFDPASNASSTATLGCAGFVVLDDNDQLLDYTAESRAGSARALSYPAGGSFGSFALTNGAPDRFGTTMQLLGGQASAPTQVVAAFVAPPQDNSIKPVSDMVDLSGTNSDPVVIKIDFDPNVAGVAFGANYLSYLVLGWSQNSTGKWKNAVLGNTGTTMPTFFNRGYNPATDFHLGYFGVDATNKYAWAVVNHNSQFVVTFPPPELAVRSVTRPSAGLIRLNCTGEPARVNRVEVSSNLQTWSTLATVTAAGDGSFTYDDAAAGGGHKFYRVAYP